MPTHRFLLLGCALVAGAAAVWLLARGPGSAGPTSDPLGNAKPAVRNPAAPPPAAAPPPTLLGRSAAAPSSPAGKDPVPEKEKGCVLAGTVVDEAGEPLAGVAVQALLAEDTPAGGTRTFGEGVVTGADGRFRLLVGGSGDALLVAGLRGKRPAAVPVTLALSVEREIGSLRLEAGAVLAGRVRCGGVPKERITVIATWYGTRKDGIRPAGDGRLWVEDGRAIWSQVEAHPDDDGRFRFEGLEDGPYRLRVPAEDWGCALHPDAYVQVDFLTRAPNEHLVVEADRSQLVIEVADGDRLVQNAIVTLDGRDAIRLDSNTNGEVGVVVPAGRRFRVTIEAAGFAPANFDVTSAEPGGRRRERVPLVPKPGTTRPSWPRAFLSVTARGPDGVPLAARCRLLDAAGVPVPCRFVDQRPVVQVLSTERLGIVPRTRVEPPLTAGTYTVELSAPGLGSVQRTVEVPLFGLFRSDGDTGGPDVEVVLRGR